MLIVFTRYPRPGQAKTRLIPALGAEGAARLQVAMTEHCLVQARGMAQCLDQSIAIYYANGELAELRTWLGIDLQYQPQNDGDLGAKMLGAFRAMLNDSATAKPQGVVIIGTDCPGIDTALLVQAFRQLATSDVVLGPALDGGYYLIGLRQVVPELFENIAWSSDRVLHQTLKTATHLGLKVALLPPLPDIDRPEDLQYLPPHLR